MNKRDWEACKDPVKMLEFLKPYINDRLLRLFACKCGRRVLHLIQDPFFERLLSFAERRAAGHFDTDEFKSLFDEAGNYDAEAMEHEVPTVRVLAMNAAGEPAFMESAYGAAVSVSTTAAEAVGMDAGHRAGSKEYDAAHQQASRTEMVAQAEILRSLCADFANDHLGEL